MPSENNTLNLREWLRTCPVLSNAKRFHVDYLSDEPVEYSIFSVPSALKYRENILGESVLRDIQIQNFIFAAKAPYGADAEQNLANLGFFQGVMEWIMDQNNARNFPEWEDGMVQSIVPTLTAYPASSAADAARYQIQVRVTYRIN